MAVPKLEVLAHDKLTIVGTSASGNFDIRPTANQTWTIKSLHLCGDLLSDGGGSSTLNFEIIDNDAVVDNIPIDTIAQLTSGTTLVNKEYAFQPSSIVTVIPFPVLNMTLNNTSFLRVNLIHAGLNSATSFMNTFVTGVRRIL